MGRTNVKPPMLFDVNADYGPADVAWSHSRRSALEQCPRRYYYHYFGASTRHAPTEPLKERIRFLKSVQGRHERAGNIVHQLIAAWLKKAQRGELWTADRMANWGRDLFRRDWQFSAQNPDGRPGDPGDEFPPTLLREFNQRDRNAHALCAEAEARIRTGLANFVNGIAFEPFRRGGAATTARVEERLKLSSLPCRVQGRVDLAYIDGDTITVADWKLAASDGAGATSLQLAVYGLWAREQFPQASTLRVFKAYLADSVAQEFELNEDLERAARVRIIQDAQRMAAVQRYGLEGTSEAFTACAQARVCALCKYRTVCREGSTTCES